MKGPCSSYSPNAWNKLMILGQKQGSIKLSDLAHEMALGEDETLAFIRQIFPLGTGIEIYHHENDCWLDIDAHQLQYMLPLSPAEWIQLQEILSSVENKITLSPVFHSLKQKVTENGPIKVIMELLNQLEHWDHQLNDQQQAMLAELDKAIELKLLMNMQTNNEKNYRVWLCKVLHLDGNLSLIAEDSKDHCMVVITLQDLVLMEEAPQNGQPIMTNFAIEEFIVALRSMNEKETRLILKIHHPESVNLFPNHHFLGKPCMITNPNGDLIWAAYVEPCVALFDWLYGLGKKVEILDPGRFKDEYLSYCEEKIRKIA